MRTTQPYFLHVLSRLHVGSGISEGAIDLPIARETATRLPVVPGSTLKGALRAQYETFVPGHKKGAENAVFGAASAADDRFAGALSVSDARLLCLPVPSPVGVFAWVTCPFLLRRYRRDAALGTETPSAKALDRLTVPPLTDGSDVIATDALVRTGSVYLQDFRLTQNRDHTGLGSAWAQHLGAQYFTHDDPWRTLFESHFAVVSDTVFGLLHFTGTEVSARIRLEPETRTVIKGGLWYEESLPEETLLYGLMKIDTPYQPEAVPAGYPDAAAIVKTLSVRRVIQMGGNETIGQGDCQWIGGGA